MRHGPPRFSESFNRIGRGRKKLEISRVHLRMPSHGMTLRNLPWKQHNKRIRDITADHGRWRRFVRHPRWRLHTTMYGQIVHQSWDKRTVRSSLVRGPYLMILNFGLLHVQKKFEGMNSAEFVWETFMVPSLGIRDQSRKYCEYDFERIPVFVRLLLFRAWYKFRSLNLTFILSRACVSPPGHWVKYSLSEPTFIT